MRKKFLTAASTLVMVVSCAFSLGLSSVFAQTEIGSADANGWVQNANMTQLSENAEGASEFTFTAGGVTTYNATALDLTQVNKLVFRSTAGNWTGFYLADNVSEVLSGGGLYLPGANNIRVSALLQSNLAQLGSGYSTTGGMVGCTAGAPSDISKYFTVEFYIGTGSEGDASYLKINGVQVVGEPGSETLSVTRADFTDGKCYIVLQTLGQDMTIAAAAPNAEVTTLPEAAFYPFGLGSAAQAGFVLTAETAIPALSDEGYALTAAAAVDNVSVNGQPISSVNAILYLIPVDLGTGVKQPCLGLIPESGSSFAWKVGDVIRFRSGFTVVDASGVGYSTLQRDYSFTVTSLDEGTGSCAFTQQIGIVSVGANGNFVNMDLTFSIPSFESPVSVQNVTQITVNGTPLCDAGGYVNLATNSIYQILKSEGDWTWADGDVIILKKGLLIQVSDSVSYSLDANYILTYGGGTFTIRQETGDTVYQPVSVTGLVYATLSGEGLYGMQVHFNENVRGTIEVNADIAGEAWFSDFVKVNGKTLAQIKQIVVQEGETPVYATVRAIFEGENYVTLWVDSRAKVIEPGQDKVGDGTVVTVMPGLCFPSGFATEEESSFEWRDPSWQETVVLEQLELDLSDGQLLEVGIEPSSGQAFANIGASILGERVSVPSCFIQMSSAVNQYVTFNGSYGSQLPTMQVIQFNSANVLQIKPGTTQWTVGDKLVLLRGMQLFDDEANKPSAKPIGELAYYYILECVDSTHLKVTVTDFYEADEDIELDYAGMQSFTYSATTDTYSFRLNFSKNIRGDVYEKFADITQEAWIRDFVRINGKSIEELLAAKAADGSAIEDAVQVLFEGDDYFTIYISAKIPQDAGGVLDADGKVLDGITVQILDNFTVPRGGVMPLGITYKYEFGGWCEDLDLSQLEYGEIRVISVDNPISVDQDGNIAFKIQFDKNVSDTVYEHINAGADWLLGVGLGYTPSTINYLASYGFIRDCLTKILYNGMTIQELMESEADAVYRPVNVVMVHYSGSGIQLVFRTNSVNENDGTLGQRTQYAINPAEENPAWTITVLEGFTVPTLCKTSQEYTFTYNAASKKFEQVIEEEIIEDVAFEEVYYDGVKIEEGGTLTLQNVTSLDKNIFTVVFVGGVNAPWEIQGGELKVGENAVKLVASTTDGSGKTVEFAFTVTVTEAETEKEGGCNGAIGAIGSVACAAVLLAAAAAGIRRKGKEDEE